MINSFLSKFVEGQFEAAKPWLLSFAVALLIPLWGIFIGVML